MPPERNSKEDFGWDHRIFWAAMNEIRATEDAYIRARNAYREALDTLSEARVDYDEAEDRA